jgi:hypothetical protein
MHRRRCRAVRLASSNTISEVEFAIPKGVPPTLQERAWTVTLIQEAIEFHIAGLKQYGDAIPEPSSSIEFVEVAA